MKTSHRMALYTLLFTALMTGAGIAEETETNKPIEPTLIDAFYNPKTGEIFVSHPTEKNVLVPVESTSKSKLKKNIKQASSEKDGGKNCVYTTQTVCTHWVNSPSSYSGKICAGTMEVRTVNCN